MMVTARLLHSWGPGSSCSNKWLLKPLSEVPRISPGEMIEKPHILFVLMAVMASISLLVGDWAWSAVLPPSNELKPRNTVAAGFGFQDSEQSSITVKTYDAESGEVLSAETYELDIKDDGPPSNRPRARIFAGGVGHGADGLSEFTIRVYDAADGRFLWEGRLNLTVGENQNTVVSRVAAHHESRAVVTKVSGLMEAYGQPYFVLRVVNPDTGQLVWADEFSADLWNGRVERISRRAIGVKGSARREIEFRIKMPDVSGRRLLWEDRVIPGDGEAEAESEPSDAAAGMLPAWPQHERERQEGI